MKTYIQKITIGAMIYFATSVAQAVYCDADCTISYKDILSTLSENASYSQREDFKADCSHRNGSITSNSNGGLICYKTGSIHSSVYGSAPSLYEARQNARNECSKKAKYYSNASSSVSNFQCAGW